MTATYNPAEIERLIAEAREDDARMTPGPLIGGADAVFLEDGRTVLAEMEIAARRLEDSIGFARSRNNLAAMADQLESARVEIWNLGSQLAHERGRVEGAAIGAEYLKRELEAARERIVELETALAQVRQ